MPTTLHPASTVASRSLTTRRPKFDYGDGLGSRHFAQGDLLTSHFIAVMSAFIPEGERFVVDAVKRYRDDIEDPALKAQANAFVGQESVHQREHDRLNGVLRQLGYPMRTIEHTATLLRRLGRRLPRRTQLGITAAIEHWTAVLAEHVLDTDRMENSTLDSEVQAMIVWHLIEEIEHKSVAFDIMQALGTTEAQRFAAMRILLLLVGPGLAFSMLVSLALDPAARDPRNLRRSLQWMGDNSAMASGGFRADIATWFREGFHPDERSHEELLERWRDKAFGTGSIVEARSARSGPGA